MTADLLSGHETLTMSAPVSVTLLICSIVDLHSSYTLVIV